MTIGETIGLNLGPATRDAFGDALSALGADYPELVVVDGDVANSTRTEVFGEAYPDRFFSVGIAESNMVSVAAGLASCGHIAVASSFAAFLTCNSYDQIRMSVGFPHLNVKLVGSHAGISIGEDGPSQMGIEDLSLMSSIPGMTVLVPADGPSATALTRLMIAHEGPVYMRTGRPKVPVIYGDGEPELEIGRARQLRDGGDATIIACGLMVGVALEAAALLASRGTECRVLDMHTIKPLDEAAVAAASRDTGCIVTAEEHLLDGGLGSSVARAAAKLAPCKMAFVGVDNTFAESGKPQELLDKYGLSVSAIVAAVERARG